MKTNIFLLLVGLLLFSGQARHAFSWESAIRIENRCEEDSIDRASGIGRNTWAKRCGYISQRTWDYNIFDDGGKERGRPYYPTFSSPDKFHEWWRAPTSADASCFESMAKKYSRIVTCLASCYTPDQMLLFEGGEVAIKTAFDQKLPRIVTLDEGATLDSLSFTIRDLDAYSVSIRDVSHEIYHIETDSGGTLKITDNHPVLISTGVMKEAKDLQLTDSLIKENGDFDRILKIEKQDYFGKVYNVQPKASSRLGQVVVAQGFLNGSLWYQNTGAMYINRLLLRDSIPGDLI